MIVMYKGDATINCDRDQVAILQVAGWSLTKPQKVEAPKKLVQKPKGKEPVNSSSKEE